MTQTGPNQHPDQDRLRRMRIAVVVAIATVVALVAVLAVVLLRDSGSEPGATPPSPSTTPSATASTTPTPGTPSSTPTTSPTPTPTPTVRAFAYQPLWPFTSSAQAAAWQRSYRSGGHQPWHLDAGQTALSFTTGFLGFTEIDRVVSRLIRGDEARIGVGYQTGEGSGVGTAAVLHLVKIGQGLDAPWEVVGTVDSTFSLLRPRYGATVMSPLTVGGRITGVDESIRIDVRQPSSSRPIGTSCCVPAGGDHQAWSARVTFSGATDPALTIVASTGGHLQGVERFTITAAHPGSTS